MAELLLHTGTEHPELTWIVVASIATLALGIAIGLFSDRVRSLFVRDADESPGRE